MSSGAEVDEEVLSDSNSRASSSTSESRLPDRSGTSVDEYRPSELLEDIEIAGVVALASETGSQQNVSLFHSLQERFSNLRPSSSDPAHLEKTVHMLKRFSTFLVSTLCIRPTSTVKTGASNREGMVLFGVLDRTSCYACRDTAAIVCSRLNREAFVGGRIGVDVMDRSCAKVVEGG